MSFDQLCYYSFHLGQRLDGESSLREVRQRQSVQYVQESLKFNEKQKEVRCQI